MKKNYLTIDLGATSGRTILFSVEIQELTSRELTRFENPIITLRQHDYWDLWALFNEIIKALKLLAQENVKLESLGIDTWGVDVVPFGKDGAPLRNPLCYRDLHTQGVPERVFQEMPEAEIYAETGIETVNFNTLFQLRAMRDAHNSAFENADKWLFMPDALSYLLCGKMVCERTIASTSMMLNAHTRDWSDKILKISGLRREQLPKLVEPGTVIGELTDEIQKITGLNAVKVVAVAGHDTASAVAAINFENEGKAFLSSGTWSLMGLALPHPVINEKSAKENITNECGCEGTTTFLKNLTGMWLIESCRREWKRKGVQLLDYQELIKQAEASDCNVLIQTSDQRFSNPSSMIDEIFNAAQEQGISLDKTKQGDYARVIFRSLAQRYKQVFNVLQEFSDVPLTTLNIIGGGCQNQYLNRLTEEALGVKVIAGPVECTALGNVKMQIKALNDECPDLRSARRL